VFRKNYASSVRFLRYQHEMAYLLAKGAPELPYLVNYRDRSGRSIAGDGNGPLAAASFRRNVPPPAGRRILRQLGLWGVVEQKFTV